MEEEEALSLVVEVSEDDPPAERKCSMAASLGADDMVA